jgi:hypothetical protein
MIRNKKVAWVFVVSVLVNVLIVVVLRGRQFSLAEILGGTLGLMLAPYLFAFLTKWACQFFSIRFDERSFHITYAVVWTVLVVANILA